MGKPPQPAPRNRRGIHWLIQTIIPRQPYPSLTKLISQPSLVCSNFHPMLQPFLCRFVPVQMSFPESNSGAKLTRLKSKVKVK